MIFKCCSQRSKSSQKLMSRESLDNTGPKLKTIARKNSENQSETQNKSGVKISFVNDSKSSGINQNEKRPRTPAIIGQNPDQFLKDYVFPRSATLK
ncbi:unnamed protein product [Blepharisma stoltei]|uniref:Uncharacterized protein n=1 Tax=Blepharisma stoltei TaxID=1481888 RepID=A0AAU9JBS7_9CILI|nr:unnamed protein product [Blepharisma stoltei]